MRLIEKPRFTDPLTFMAKAYELMGNFTQAIATHKHVIKLLEEEHNIISGELVDSPNREIKRLSIFLT